MKRKRRRRPYWGRSAWRALARTLTTPHRATGAGAGARQSIGTTVFGGMILATFVGVLFIPRLFVITEKITERLSRETPRRKVRRAEKVDADEG